MALSGSAIIVIVVCVAGLLVTILWVFSGHYRETSTVDSAVPQISHEQSTYMRQVRQRNFENAYAQSVVANADEVTIARNSRYTPISPVAARQGTGQGPRRSNSYGMSMSSPSHNVASASYQQQQEKDGSRVNYSRYDDQMDYFEQQHQQSPYAGHAYDYNAYEQPTSDEKFLPHQQV